MDKYQSVKTGLDRFRPEPFIRQIVDPTLPENPSSPNKLLNVAMALVIGLMAGVGIVFFVSIVRTLHLKNKLLERRF